MEHESLSNVLVRKHGDNSRKWTSNRFPCDVRILVIIILATLLCLNYSSNYLNNLQEFQNFVKSDASGNIDGHAWSNQELIPLHEDNTIIDKNALLPKGIQKDKIIDSYTENRVLPSNTSENVDAEENTMACQLPKLNAFDPNIKEFWEKPAESFDCKKGHPLLFHTDLDSNLIVEDSPSWSNFSDCCYKELFRAKGTDDSKYNVSSNCEPIISNITKIPSTMQYIVVHCINRPSKNLTLIDMFDFVNLKPDLEERCKRVEATENSTRTDALNVVILGMDSLSRLNFIRTMPKTHEFISKRLSAISMEGLTKVGDNTLPVLLPGLAGMSLAEANETCFGKSRYFDTCPLIWKNFTDAGYRTSFGEDAPNMAIFNYLLNGFQAPPTDYYLRPMMKALKTTMGYLKSLNVHLCYGPRIPFEILLDFMKKTAYTLGNTKKYFQLIWSSTMSHDILNNPKMGDESLFQTLKWLQTEGYLNNTVLILMSDHGMRFGKFRDTYQGSIEARMPYWFTMFPKWFTQKYAKAIKIFRRNANRLTTHYDFHETLLDLLHLENIADTKIEEKVKRLELDTKHDHIPRGISLFLPIPLSRNCSTAEIPEHYCVCNAMKPMPVYVYTVDPDILSATKAVIIFINKITSPYPDCAQLKLKNVTSALKATSVSQNIQETMDKQMDANDTVSYIVNFITLPGDGNFEASAFGSPTQGNWAVSGEISRTNLYGNQSHCVNDKILKKYCYCKD